MINDPLGILDRNLTIFETAYSTFVPDHVATNSIIIAWHTLSFGGPPSDDWVEHIRWRISDERERWITLRNALQDAAPLPVPVSPIEQIKPQKHYLIGVTGTRFTAIECTAFLAFKQYLDGYDITPILAQRRDIGFNMLRVWATGNWNDPAWRIIPSEYPGYYEKLAPFAQLIASEGFYLEFTAFADPQNTFPGGQAEQVEHWNKFCAALAGQTNVLIELVNENDVTGHLNPAVFLEPNDTLACHGSNGSQSWPPTPHWKYLAFHTNGAPEEQRKVGHNAWEIDPSKPVITNETSRYWEVGMWLGSDLNRQKRLAYDSAAGAALLCAGSCFHSVNGKTNTEFTPEEKEVAIAWVTGANSVPLMFQDGQYLRDDNLGPDELRKYGRRLPDGQVYWVVIHK